MLGARRSESKFYLMEAYDPTHAYRDGVVVSLTPRASFELEKRGLPYKILEDFFDENKILEYGDHFFYGQIEWMKSFDRFLKKNIDLCRLRDFDLIYSQYYRVKFFLDSLIILSLRCREFIKTAHPKSVVYVGLDHSGALNNHSIHDIYHCGEKFFRPIIELCCQAAGVSFEAMQRASVNEAKKPFRGKPPRGKPLWRKYLKRVYSCVKFQTYRRLFYTLPSKKSFLFLHLGERDTAPIVKSLISRGSSVFVKEEGEIYSLGVFGEKKILDLNDASQTTRDFLESDFERASAQLIHERDLVQWMNDQCQLNLEKVVLPYFTYLVRQICFDIAREAEVLVRFYEKYQIDFVVARASIELFSISPLVAAKKRNRTKRVCFQHGGHTRETPVFHMEEIEFFDYFFAFDPETREYLKESQKIIFGNSCQIHEYSHFLKSVVIPKKRSGRGRETIVYAPTRTNVGIMMLNHIKFSSEWYYEFQKALIDYFLSKTDKIFIFKYIERDDWLPHSTLLYLKSKSPSNILLESKPLVHCLSRADRVILDFPGTSLYEVGVAGVPMLALYPNRVTMRSTAKRYFGRVLEPYQNARDAIQKIDLFLKADPSAYKVDIPLSASDPLDILLSEANVAM